ncbi:MAG: hypothetical protein RR202_05915 [Bacteroidales bacterium]
MEENPINTKEYHKNLWKCRDFEIQHLWQRSVFLTAFMLLTFSGYGALLIKIVEISTAVYGADIISVTEPVYKNVTLESVGNNLDYLYLLNVIAQFICIIGMIFSILWIMMGKGSKAWYEVYENAIGAFEKSDYTTFKKIGGFQYHQLTDFISLDIDDNIFSTSGGKYSPSKINIMIGVITLVIWALLILFHVGLSYIDFDLSAIPIKHYSYFMPFTTGIILVIFYVFGWKMGQLKSNALIDYEK